MECKENVEIINNGSSSDLIETLWNVKELKELEKALKRCGFNRNIMECKEQIKNWGVIFY